MITAVALAVLVVLHRLDGAEVVVNSRTVTSLHSPGRGRPLLPKGSCAVWLTDGRLISVIEPCSTVRKMLEEAGGGD